MVVRGIGAAEVEEPNENDDDLVGFGGVVDGVVVVVIVVVVVVVGVVVVVVGVVVFVVFAAVAVIGGEDSETD